MIDLDHNRHLLRILARMKPFPSPRAMARTATLHLNSRTLRNIFFISLLTIY